jgi:hypothetical protein
MLYLLTFADMRAVGPGVMTGWMARILWEVYTRTLVSLTGGRLERPSRETVAERVAEEARGSRGAAVAHLAMMSVAISPPPPPSESPPTSAWSSGWRRRRWRPSSSTIPTSGPPRW